MNQVELISETIYRVVCPHCSKTDSQVDHLFQMAIDRGGKMEFGEWSCKSCRGAYKGIVKVSEEGNKIFLEAISDTARIHPRYEDSLVFLRYHNMLLVIKDEWYAGDWDNREYYYNEHVCPTGFLSRVEYVIDIEEKDTDPHGIFEFIDVIPYVQTDHNDAETILKLLPDDIWHS